MLPRLVHWLVRAVAPARRADTVLADLERDDAAHDRPSRARAWWLARETSSLITAYTWSRVHAGRRSLPLLFREGQLVVRGLRRGGMALLSAGILLSVGIAAVLITAGLVQTLLLRQVSATHGERLRRVVAIDREGRVSTRFSYPELQSIHAQIGDAGAVGAVYLQPVLLRIHNRDVQTMAEIVEGPYFALTGMAPVIGRGLMIADDRLDAAPVAVLAEPFWRRQFDARPDVLGAVIQLNGTSYSVVGVAGVLGSSSSLGASVDAWVSAAHADPLVNAGWRSNVRERWFTSFVLPAGEIAAVDQRLAVAAVDLARDHPDPWRDRRLQTSDATVMIGSQRSAARMLAWVLAGLAALIVLAAGTNMSGVLVARAAANQRQAAIHLSIGAGRRHVMRRLVIEGALVGLVGGVLAVGLYVWARALLADVSLLPTLALRLDLPLSPGLMTLALAGGLATGAVLALGPALWSTRLDIAQALGDGDGRSGGRARATMMRRTLVSAQVCLSLVLTVGAALFGRSLDALAAADLGFSRARLVAMDLDVEPVVRMPEDLPVLARDVLTRVNALPDVVAAAMSSRAPVDPSTPAVELQRPGDDASRLGDVTVYLATERYFETVGVALASGRSFAPDEVAVAADVVIVNATLAARLWPGEDALDRAIYLPAEAKTLRVVGVAQDSKYRALTESSRPHIYRPAAPALGLTLLARTRDNPRVALQTIQRVLDGVGPGVVGFFPRTMDDHLAVQLLPTRAAAKAASALGVLALALSAVALYALVSWFVTLRRREIGVRMALGASVADVRRLVVCQALAAAAPGVVVGLVLALVLGRAAQSALYGVSPADPVSLGVGVGALAIVILIAGYVPSRAATRADPAQTLRL